MNKIEHIGIAVKDIESSVRLFSRIFNVHPYKSETVESEGVITSFYRIGETKIELLQATGPDSPIAKFIEKRGEGIHHIAFAVDDSNAEISRLTAEGIEMLQTEAKAGADNKMIAFAHPKSTNGVLMEFCSDNSQASLDPLNLS